MIISEKETSKTYYKDNKENIDFKNSIYYENNKSYHQARVRTRKLSLINRTPAWANLEKIKEIYKEAERKTIETGIPYEVDHIIPLHGKIISGLHIETNLQVITRTENRIKFNSF